MRIGIVNAWGTNRGDEAMLSALLCHCQTKLRECQITVYSKGDLDLRRFGVRVVPWLTEGPLLTRLLTKSLRRIPNLRDAQTRIAQTRLRMALPLWVRNANVFQHDLVISSPAGPYFGDLYPKTEACCLTPLAICAKRCVPFGVLAVSCGPFQKESLNPLRREILSQAGFWTVREDISRKHLETLGLPCAKHCGGDLVFAHPDRNSEAFLEERHREAYEKAEQRLQEGAIILTLSHTVHVLPTGAMQRFDPAVYAAQMGSFLQHVFRTTRRQILIFPHFYGSALEQRNIRNVIEAAGADKRIFVLDQNLNAEAQMQLHSQAEFSISHRYHPAIFAFRAGRPCMCVRHQFKVDGLMAMFGEPGPSVRTTDSAEDWIKAFDETWENRESIARQIQQRLPEVRDSSLKHLEILNPYLVESAAYK